MRSFWQRSEAQGMELAIVMLAAGYSRRFGENKLLYPVEGIPIYGRVLDQLLAVRGYFDSERGEAPCRIKNITVVTQYEEIGKAAENAGVQAIYNPHPERGISFSLQLGLLANEKADALLFAVGDQPWLSADTVIDLIRLFVSSGKGIAGVSSLEKIGNPCIFSKAYYQELKNLEGDVGGKRVLNCHKDDTAVLPVEDARELMDLDIHP